MILRYKRHLFLGGAAIVLGSTLVMAQDAPESLLPPGFDDPAPTPKPTPRSTAQPAPRATTAPTVTRPSAPSGGGTSVPVIQPLPGGGMPDGGSASLPSGLPSLEELENMEIDELDELLGLKPKFDIPPAARRAMSEVGLLSQAEGGLLTISLANQPASIVRASLAGIRGPDGIALGAYYAPPRAREQAQCPVWHEPGRICGFARTSAQPSR